ncbi:acyl carrier protein-like protein, partial [Gonapodya prolifera JEL478]
MLSRIVPRVAAAATSRGLLSATVRQALPATPLLGSRLYASGSHLDKGEVETRVLAVLRGFGKVDPAKIAPTARFIEDLGLDSLDAVEVTMAIEDEFNIELTDEEAEKVLSVPIAVETVVNHGHAL